MTLNASLITKEQLNAKPVLKDTLSTLMAAVVPCHPTA